MKNLIIVAFSVVAVFASALLKPNGTNKSEKVLISVINPSALVATGPHR